LRIDRRMAILGVEEARVKSAALKTFLLGVTLGVGATILCLYTRKPDRIFASMDAIAEVGRKRRAEEEEKRVRRERLKGMGFSNEEIDDIS
jgi:hypothetical protein